MKKKITITLPEETNTILENLCKNKNKSKSEFIKELIEKYEQNPRNAGRKEKLTDTEKELIYMDYQKEVPVSKIARHFEISRNLVYKIIKEHE